MAVRMSTGMVNSLMAVNSFKSTLESGSGFIITIYSGSQPASADDAPTGTALVTLSSSGGGTTLSFEGTASGGALAKSSGQTWSGTAVATGTAGWFRVKLIADTNASSTSFARYDGACATSGAQLNLGSLTITNGAPITVSNAAFTMPKSI